MNSAGVWPTLTAWRLKKPPLSLIGSMVTTSHGRMDAMSALALSNAASAATLAERAARLDSRVCHATMKNVRPPIMRSHHSGDAYQCEESALERAVRLVLVPRFE